jgi:L-threonylcarbamoyladenylate synthase
MDAAAVEKVFAAKNRSERKPVSILIPERAALDLLVASVTAEARGLMDRFWPGQLTLVFRDAGRLPDVLTAGSGKIGIRLPWHPVARDLVLAVGEPITATSANISGQPGARDIQDLSPSVAAAADIILDAGRLESCSGSTVVDVVESPVRILREGVIASGEIQEASTGASP